MENSIESIEMNLNSLFHDFYRVPQYQREYVWEYEQVQNLLEDAEEEFGTTTSTNNYFIGTMITILNNKKYDIIDGQQRLTTIFIFLCVVRDLLIMEKGKKINDLQSLLCKIANFTDDPSGEIGSVKEFKVHLLYKDSQDILEEIGKNPEERGSIEDIDKKITNKTKSVKRIINTYRTIWSYMYSWSEDQIWNFYLNFLNNVRVVRIVTPSESGALQIFERINSRGLGLDNLSLIKNLLFINVRNNNEMEDINITWKDITNNLESCNEDPDRFLRYFIFSNYESDIIKKREAYSWFKKDFNRQIIEKNPIDFIKKLHKQSLFHNKLIKEKRNFDNTSNPYLENLFYLNTSARQPLILLLAARDLPKDLFQYLSQWVENYYAVNLLSGGRTNELEGNFQKWAQIFLKEKPNNKEQLDIFINKTLKEKILEKKDKFYNEFINMSLTTIKTLSKLKYILAKIEGYLYAKANNVSNLSIGNYLNKNITIEHILPETEGIWRNKFDKPHKEYYQRLGNLTLLEDSINSSLSNREFENKKKGYFDSNIILTKSIARKPSGTKDTKIDKIYKNCLIQFEKWDSVSIEKRQEMLANVALKTWGIIE